MNIRPGESIPQVISTGIEWADILALVLSKNANRSQWVQDEWAAMVMRGKPVVCIKIDDEDPPVLLGHRKYIQYRGDIGEVVSEVSRAEGLHKAL